MKENFNGGSLMNYSSLDALCEKLNITVKIDEKMASYTSFKVGGLAKRFIEIENEKQAIAVMNLIFKENLSYFIIGNGSNILVNDYGIDAVVIKLVGDFDEIEIINETTIKCGAGVKLSNLCVFAKNNSLKGLEFAYGIPATVGGAVYMNAGAYGGEMKDVVLKTSHIKNGNLETYEKKELEFSYRHSIYNNANCLITSAILSLEKGEKSEIENKMAETMAKRKDKQPLEFPSAGSTFKRPKNYFAAALIEECGLKGTSVGGAEVSRKHSGFIINKGGATASDILELIQTVKTVVKKEKNVDLECEIKLIGGK